MEKNGKWVKVKSTQIQKLNILRETLKLHSFHSEAVFHHRMQDIHVQTCWKQSNVVKPAPNDEMSNWLCTDFPKNRLQCWLAVHSVTLFQHHYCWRAFLFMLSFVIQFNNNIHSMEWPLICALKMSAHQPNVQLHFRVTSHFDLTVNWIRLTFER